MAKIVYLCNSDVTISTLTSRRILNGRCSTGKDVWQDRWVCQLGPTIWCGQIWTSAHQMSVNGKYDDITRTDLMELAARNNIRNAGQIINEIGDTCAGWAQIAKECDVPQKMIDKIFPNMLLSI